MRIILLLCAALALTITAVPVEEVPAAQEIQQVPVEEVPAAQEIQQVPVEEKPAAQEIQQVDGELPVEVEVEEVKLEAKTGSCSAGWAKFGSRCFNFISSKKTWVEAERYCLRFGTNLASVHSQEEYEFVQEVVRGTTGHFPQAWLGANDAVKDDVWLWSDGSKFSDSFWAEGEPNNYLKNERCVVMNLSAFLLWGDVRCDVRLPFVCGTRPQFRSRPAGAPLTSRGGGYKPSLKFPPASKKKETDKRAKRGSNLEGQSRGPWLVGSRRFSPSRRMPRRQQRRRKARLLTRRLQLRPHWSTPAQSAGHRCLIPRHSSSILRANTPSPPCLLSSQTFRHEVSTGLDLNLDTQ